jgi:tetratricopeptide (TPR) repeat protein
MAKSPYSIPFWIASLSLFEGCKEFRDVLLYAERFPAVKNNISLSTYLVPLYSRIGCTNRKLCYWHRKNLKEHIDDHLNRFSLARAYFYERNDTQAQNEFLLLQTRQDAIALLSQLYLAWIDERSGKFDSKEIVELETCLKSGKLRGNLLVLTNQLLARVYAKKGEFKEADEIINLLQYNYKTEALHYYTLGVIEELKTNISNAQSYYQKYLSIPNGKFHLNGLYISSLLKKTLNDLSISYPYRFEI